MTEAEMNELATREKKCEAAPPWESQVPPLEETLRIPHEDNEVIESMDDVRAEPHFKEKNILIWRPHIYFI